MMVEHKIEVNDVVQYVGVAQGDPYHATKSEIGGFTARVIHVYPGAEPPVLNLQLVGNHPTIGCVPHRDMCKGAVSGFWYRLPLKQKPQPKDQTFSIPVKVIELTEWVGDIETKVGSLTTLVQHLQNSVVVLQGGTPKVEPVEKAGPTQKPQHPLPGDIDYSEPPMTWAVGKDKGPSVRECFDDLSPEKQEEVMRKSGFSEGWSK